MMIYKEFRLYKQRYDVEKYLGRLTFHNYSYEYCMCMIHIYIANNFSVQIEDLSQQAQVAAAEKFKEPPVAPPAEAGGSTTVRYDISV